MQKENVYQNETVLRIDINLTLLAAVYGDLVTAAAFFEGLQSIVRLRGGMEFFRARPTLQSSIELTLRGHSALA